MITVSDTCINTIMNACKTICKMSHTKHKKKGGEKKKKKKRQKEGKMKEKIKKKNRYQVSILPVTI